MTGWKGHPAVLLAMMLVAGTTDTAAQERRSVDDLPQIEPGSAPMQERKSRLKYKRGPTCMCVKGTSEEEIRAAEETRRAGNKK